MNENVLNYNTNILYRMGIFFFLLSIFMFTSTVTGLIIPEELPSILSLIFSNIPPIKKGTDSRIGLGFRLGEHADFQTIVELGPQKETDPIGNGESKRRRQIILESTTRGNYGPWDKSEDKINLEKVKRKTAEFTDFVKDQKKEHDDGNWLLKWSKKVASAKNNGTPLARRPMIQTLRTNNGNKYEPE
ncbi:uncharacterized protein LOC103574932 isoform X2 [Microplitis demolitor]|uniref:uncharacterized protein LOC103574932 isoform X2 n=1 Tax=Microplitis demolitor TaxID=69319 RepID=UPI0004CCF731|nr:uncharacterized protein LOC103574932 isoform X2 [Microplitis demolitor]